MIPEKTLISFVLLTRMGRGVSVRFASSMRLFTLSQADHQEHGPRVADSGTGQKIGWNPYRRRNAEANKLAFRQVERNFGFDFR